MFLKVKFGDVVSFEWKFHVILVSPQFVGPLFWDSISYEIFDDIIHWETLLEITQTCEMTFFKYHWDELFKQGVKACPK